ncbi:uncharacterized protein LOC128016514 [Carassius gibelio]|uniref:uncharacterized protein LOC128016514 n=1 Tax=Carassius gibelio TaxID=101364 RepID=UPI0022798A24|nr:uncharacterized protein LOC128016514 [Carassius gibelio]
MSSSSSSSSESNSRATSLEDLKGKWANSDYRRVISYSAEYLLFRNKSKRLCVFLLNATSFVIVTGTYNPSRLPFLLLKLDLSTSTPANEDKTTLPAKCETGGAATLDVSPSENHREEQHRSKLSSTPSVRHRSKTHAQLIKDKLGQIKAEMQKISEVHLHQRPERKAYHPFVWNSLSPYRDTTEIDHLLTMTTDPDRRKCYSSVKTESTQLSK